MMRTFFVPRLPPEPKPKPPAGFRFATDPPDMNQLVHIDNEHPFANARPGETIDVLHGYTDRTVIGTLTIIGWMKSDDRRAKVVSGGTVLNGLYVEGEDGSKKWIYIRYVHRQHDGRLNYVT